MAGKDNTEVITIDDSANINEMASDVAKIVYKGQLDSLIETLNRFHTPTTRYTIMDVKDDSYCMIYRDGNWVTFASERGAETSVSIFEGIDDACFKVMYYMASDMEEYNQMVYYYKHSMSDLEKNNFTSRDLFFAVKNGMEKIKKSVAVI